LNGLFQPTRDADGRITGVANFAFDVTAQVLARRRTESSEAEFRALAEKLQEALRLRDDFMSMAGHELRTPLAAMMLQIESLPRASRDDARLAARLDKVASAGGRLRQLVEQLLDVSRLQAGRFELQPRPIDLVELVGEIVARHAEHARAAGSELTLDAPTTLRGTWDPDRLDQILTNLLGNALTYGRGDRIEVRLRADGDTVRLEVSDHGVGIAPEVQARIFERFERGARASDHGGLGLGLWISRELVQASGGTISVDSAPGRGATFTVVLPRGSDAS
jgi:signal transduction histidine kinase